MNTSPYSSLCCNMRGGGLELSLNRVEGRAFCQHEDQLARNTYPAGRERDWAMLLRSDCCCLVSKISLPVAMTALMLTV